MEERRRPGTSRKRKSSASPDAEADGERDLQRAVQKLIHLAQLEVDSPAHGGQSIESASPAIAQPSSSPSEGQKEQVFDAYPAPSAGPFGIDGSYTDPSAIKLPLEPTEPHRRASQSGRKMDPPSRQGSGQIPSTAPPMQQNYLGIPNMAYPGATSPFTFPVDPNTAPASYPSFTTSGSTTLDPAVESFLADHFPPPGAQGGAGMMDSVNGMQGMQNSQAPEDFLNKVFSFSWENGTGSGPMQYQGPGSMMDGMGQGMPMPQGYQMGQQSPLLRQNGLVGGQQQQQQQGQMQAQAQAQGLQGMMGFDAFGPMDWGNNSGGWMA